MAWRKRAKRDAYLEGMTQEQRNKDLEKRVEAAIKRVRGKNTTLLARVKSSSRNMKHEIRLGQNGAVFCSCEHWKYGHEGTCKHLEKFRRECVAQEL